MKGSSLEAIPILLELFGHWFSFFYPPLEQVFILPYNPANLNKKKISRRSRKEIQFPADIQELECLVCGRHRYIKGGIAHCMPSFRRGASHGTQRPVVGCYSLSGWPGESQHSAGSRSPRPCFHCQIPIPLFPEVSWEGDAVRDQLARDTYMQAVTLRVLKQRLFSLLPICDLTGRPFFFFFFAVFLIQLITAYRLMTVFCLKQGRWQNALPTLGCLLGWKCSAASCSMAGRS